MHNALRLGDASREEVNEGYKSLIALLRGLDKSTDFRIANSIWYEKTFPFNDTFLTESKSFFDAEVKPLDFRSPAALTTINSWVKTSTNDKIPTILDAIDPSEVMFLINAIYFKGTWQKQFDKSETAQAPFFALDGSKADVPLMHQSVPLRVAHAASYTAIDLLYGNSAYAMTVVLPNQNVSVNTLAESLTGDSWKSLEDSFSEYKFDFFFPRFKLTWERLLNEDLRALGMGIAFDAADFTPMSPRGRELIITKVIQKTFVDVNADAGCRSRDSGGPAVSVRDQRTLLRDNHVHRKDREAPGVDPAEKQWRFMRERPVTPAGTHEPVLSRYRDSSSVDAPVAPEARFSA
jgi:serpin B